MSKVEQRLQELGMVVPEPLPIHGRFKPVVIHHDLAVASGAIATVGPPLRVAFPGRVGEDLTLDEGKASAEGALLGLLANLRAALGDLDRIDAILQIRGHVLVAPGFDKVHHVVGAATRLVGEVFGDDGLPARTAVGVAATPESASVVLDALVAIKGGAPG